MLAEDRELADCKERVAKLEAELAELRSRRRYLGIRKRSAMNLWGIPLYDIALGPDLQRGEMRGHARGIIAIGDVAIGVVAVGGLAVGGVTLGGCSIGALMAVGGFAAGGLAVGGAAVGLVAIGGAALGYFALGGGAAGEYILSATQRDPEAVQFFQRWIPGIQRWLGPRG